MPTIQQGRVTSGTGKITFAGNQGGTSLASSNNTGSTASPISFTVQNPSSGVALFDSTSQTGNAIVLALRNLVAGPNVTISVTNGLITISSPVGMGPTGPTGASITGPTGSQGASITGPTGPTGPERSAVRMQMQWTSGAVVSNDTTYFVYDPPYGGTINSLSYFTGAGSYTVAVQIAGANVTGLSAVAVSSSTPATTNATAANTFTAGQKISAVITGATGSPTDTLLSLNVTWS